MRDWLIENKEWFFSGIGGTILAFIVGWFVRKKNGKPPKDGAAVTASSPVQQTHSGSGDNVARDKIIKG